MQSILKMGALACAVLSLTNWCPQKNKNQNFIQILNILAQWSRGPVVTPQTKINELPGCVHVHSIQINVHKPDRVSATEGQLPAGGP